MEYASIELRTDVPHLAVSDGELETDLAVGEAARLRTGPVAATSALLLIAACDPSVTAEEQEKRIREATIYLTNGFVPDQPHGEQDGARLPGPADHEIRRHLPGAQERAEPEADPPAPR